MWIVVSTVKNAFISFCCQIQIYKDKKIGKSGFRWDGGGRLSVDAWATKCYSLCSWLWCLGCMELQGELIEKKMYFLNITLNRNLVTFCPYWTHRKMLFVNLWCFQWEYHCRWTLCTALDTPVWSSATISIRSYYFSPALNRCTVRTGPSSTRANKGIFFTIAAIFKIKCYVCVITVSCMARTIPWLLDFCRAYLIHVSWPLYKIQIVAFWFCRADLIRISSLLWIQIEKWDHLNLVLSCRNIDWGHQGYKKIQKSQIQVFLDPHTHPWLYRLSKTLTSRFRRAITFHSFMLIVDVITYPSVKVSIIQLISVDVFKARISSRTVAMYFHSQ